MNCAQPSRDRVWLPLALATFVGVAAVWMGLGILQEQPGSNDPLWEIILGRGLSDVLVRMIQTSIVIAAVALVCLVIRRVRRQDQSIEKRIYQTVGEASQDFMFIINRDGMVEYVNSYGASLFNCRPEQLIGKSRDMLFPPEVSVRQEEALRRVFDTGQAVSTESPIIFPDGRQFWIHNKLVPIRGEDGTVRAVFGVSRDITDRRHMEDALRESESTVRALMDARTDFIFLLDRDFRIAAINRHAAERFGKSPQELLGTTLYDLFTPEVAKSRMARNQEVVRTRQAIRFEDERAGMWFDNVVYPILDTQGEVLKLAVIARDITSKKKAQEQIRQYNEQLEAMVAERTEKIRELERRQAEMEKFAASGRLAARIAHEINNPLAGIKNSFLLIKTAVPDNHPYFDYVRRIEKEIDRIAQIVRQMFNLYRPEHAGAQEFHLREVIDDVVALLRSHCGEREVTISANVSGVRERALLPENLFRQVLYNLLMNAIEASPKGTSVTVTARLDKDALTTMVTDQGEGIPEALRSRIFEPFFTTKRSGQSGGLGLGLSVSKSVAEALKGTLDFESKPGVGTTFRLMLPLRSGSQ